MCKEIWPQECTDVQFKLHGRKRELRPGKRKSWIWLVNMATHIKSLLHYLHCRKLEKALKVFVKVRMSSDMRGKSVIQ